MLNIIKYKAVFLSVSGALMLAALIAIISFGFVLGIDFKGGALWQFRFAQDPPALETIENVFANDLKIQSAVISRDISGATFFARFEEVAESEHQSRLALAKEKLPGFEELGFQSIGPSIGAELRTRSLWGIALVLIGISLYIAFAFRKVSRPISSWKYGVITLVSLLHDVLIPAGLLALLGRIAGLEVDSNFVVALLVIMGFSVHDTIVVFDRIRENLARNRGADDFASVINMSINQTLSRSINTSLTLVLVLIALYFVGPQSLAYFVITLLVGVTLGTYSSIFVASPALLLVNRRKAR